MFEFHDLIELLCIGNRVQLSTSYIKILLLFDDGFHFHENSRGHALFNQQNRKDQILWSRNDITDIHEKFKNYLNVQFQKY